MKGKVNMLVFVQCVTIFDGKKCKVFDVQITTIYRYASNGFKLL